MTVGTKQVEWSSRFGFLMATIGCSVGLGNFWRFPYTAGENGGGWFVLAYLICVFAIGLPLLMAELAIGRRAKRSAISGVAFVARENAASPKWGIAGAVGVLASFMILTFYSVIAGWIIAYIPMSFSGSLQGLSSTEITQSFSDLIGKDGQLKASLAHAAFMLITVIIVGFGLKRGIESVVSIVMPAFFFMLVFVVAWALLTGDMGQALKFLFQPRGPEATAELLGQENIRSNVEFFGDIWLGALGQAFFSIGIGAGLMLTYGAYLSKEEKIGENAVVIASADTFVALIAGMAIFPLVFAHGLAPNAGPSLFFITLPSAFAQMPLGEWFGGIFFLLAFFAALTSSISIIEVVTSYFEEFMPRFIAVILIGLMVFGIGMLFIFPEIPNEIFAGLGPLEYLFGNNSMLDTIDFFSGKFLLPVSGLLIAIFAGYRVANAVWDEELRQISGGARDIWLFLIRFVAPIAVSVILVGGLWAAYVQYQSYRAAQQIETVETP